LDTPHRAKLILNVMTELVGQHVRLGSVTALRAQLAG
jgi:hypothetical protein